MRKSGMPTKYPGVSQIAPKSYRVRAKLIDPRTGKNREVDRVIHDVTAKQAAHVRGQLIEAARAETGPENQRPRIGEYAKSWMRSKALKLSAGTARTYASALEQHILPAFGDFYYDALTTRDVQNWVDRALTHGWQGSSGKRKPYSRDTVHGWFRVLRTMTRDAMHALGLPRDSTLRISFPEPDQPADSNTLTPEQLARFLDEMRERYGRDRVKRACAPL